MDIELDRRDSYDRELDKRPAGTEQFVKHDADKPDMRLLPMLAVKAMAAESHLVSDHYEDFVSVAVDALISTRSIRPVDRYVRAMAYLGVTLESDLVGHTTDTIDSLMPRTLLAMGRVLTHGAKKYSPDNWRRIKPEQRHRYLSAALRHLLAFLTGETLDPETGEDHRAHALCSLAFLVELELEDLDVD